MSVSQTLEKAKSLIDAPEKWTQGAWARGAKGGRVTFYHSEAACFCAQGAIMKAAYYHQVDGPMPSINKAKDALLSAINLNANEISIHEWNDSLYRTHEEVMEAFDKAIALAKAEENL